MTFHGNSCRHYLIKTGDEEHIPKILNFHFTSIELILTNRETGIDIPHHLEGRFLELVIISYGLAQIEQAPLKAGSPCRLMPALPFAGNLDVLKNCFAT